MKSKVSVIIPIYNVEKYLRKSIDSVLEQLYKNLQIILVDDGSTDGSAQICDEYLLRDNRIEVIHKKNGGLSDARNAGLINATGEYIYFLDADDYIDKELIYRCVFVMELEKCDVVVMNYVSETEEGNIIEKSCFLPQSYEIRNDAKRRKHIASVTVRFPKTGWSTWSRFYRADLIKKNNLFFPDNKEIFAEDLAFSLRISLFCKKIVVIPDAFYHYVQRKDSIMNMVEQAPIEKFVKLCVDFEEYMKNERGVNILGKYKNIVFSNVIINGGTQGTMSCETFANSICSFEISENKHKVKKWFKTVNENPIYAIKTYGRTLYYKARLLYIDMNGGCMSKDFAYKALQRRVPRKVNIDRA